MRFRRFDRCAVCGLEVATWHGDASRLCDPCFHREMQRRLEAGESVTTSTG